MTGKADGCLNSTTGHAGLRVFLQSSSKRFRLGFAAGFLGLRNAVPFDRIKAKKIPIVQPNLTFSPPKIHLKILSNEINGIKRWIFIAIPTW
ncbi:hypothetical protein NE852_15225 [Rhizobium sp. Pop5]|uniref:hypothetical protein n=1 Tax=Rhizobium sp. Pop5 TaxID=1223565 RepID=UPI002157701C|nr:hypothetical protein [Rhizobium sp. Pop5]UVD55444.1 hypothetical protein NE852_15225 [Rhizobium sp. Pop5]